MSGSSTVLSRKSLVLIFAYAPAGFGHLRVTDALYHGVSESVSPLLLGSQETSITFIHRLMSIHPIIRTFSEWAEKGVVEDIITFFYRKFLRSKTDLLYHQFVTLLDERIDTPEIVLVVATHFGLAHQLAAIKEKIEKSKHVKIILIVQVTDDSPLHIWYIEGADIIFVPSFRTRQKLLEYGKRNNLEKIDIRVNSYPLSPLLAEKISTIEYEEKKHQLTFEKKSQIHVAIPISGAAVGLSFFSEFIEELHKKSEKFIFHIVSKETSYTEKFLRSVRELPFVEVYTSPHDRGVVDQYELLYQHKPITLEVTKPSEQAFKALLDCRKKGGSILLLSDPVGRQEYDNLAFLQRHSLIPTDKEKKKLWFNAFKKNALDKITYSQAKKWRGIEIPSSSHLAAEFIWWCYTQELFLSMIEYDTIPNLHDPDKFELHPHGVSQFWAAVVRFIQTGI